MEEKIYSVRVSIGSREWFKHFSTEEKARAYMERAKENCVFRIELRRNGDDGELVDIWTPWLNPVDDTELGEKLVLAEEIIVAYARCKRFDNAYASRLLKQARTLEAYVPALEGLPRLLTQITEMYEQIDRLKEVAQEEEEEYEEY